MITTITINSVDYISYASVAEADARLAVDPVRGPTWATLSTDQKGINLVAATNRLDLLMWAGEKTGGPTQVNQWPRTGVSYKDGTPVSTTEVPTEVENATILLAGSVALDASNADAGTSGSNIEEVQAGSARVSFFRPQAGAPLQDESAYQLVQCFLAGFGADADSGGPPAGKATGTGGQSVFCEEVRFGLTEGYP